MCISVKPMCELKRRVKREDVILCKGKPKSQMGVGCVLFSLHSTNTPVDNTLYAGVKKRRQRERETPNKQVGVCCACVQCTGVKKYQRERRCVCVRVSSTGHFFFTRFFHIQRCLNYFLSHAQQKSEIFSA